MALVEAGPVPKGLEPYGTSQWFLVDENPSLGNMFQTPQEIADKVATIFNAVNDSDQVIGSRFSHAVSAISRQVLVPTVVFYDQKRPPEHPRFSLVKNGWTRSSKETPFSLGGFVMVNDDRSPYYHGIVMHVTGGEEAVTTNPDFRDERIRVESPAGYLPDRRWTERAIDCAGFIGHNIRRYVEAADENPQFLQTFLGERVKALKKLFEAHGISAERADGITRENLSFREVPYHGLLLRRPGQVLAEFRMKKRDDGLNLGLDHSASHSIGSAIRGVDYTNEVKLPLFELLHLGGADGPITELIRPQRIR
jgi:hypothetical protein